MSGICYLRSNSTIEMRLTMSDSGNKSSRHPVPERLLSNLWRKRAARRAWFRTSAGTRMRVLYPGRPSSAAGPDFRDALLEVEGVGLVRVTSRFMFGSGTGRATATGEIPGTTA